MAYNLACLLRNPRDLVPKLMSRVFCVAICVIALFAIDNSSFVAASASSSSGMKYHGRTGSASTYDHCYQRGDLSSDDALDLTSSDDDLRHPHQFTCAATDLPQLYSTIGHFPFDNSNSSILSLFFRSAVLRL